VQGAGYRGISVPIAECSCEGVCLYPLVLTKKPVTSSMSAEPENKHVANGDEDRKSPDKRDGSPRKDEAR